MQSRLWRTSAVVAALVSAAACASPEQEARDARRQAGSWAATIAVACERWSADAVPPHFVASTLQSARKALEPEASRVRQKAGAAAAAPIDRVLQALPSIDAAVKDRDSDRAGSGAKALASAVPADPTPPVARPQ